MESATTEAARLVDRVWKLTTVESLQHGLSFLPRPDDVIVTTAAKSGTTWAQQIMHGLRSNGDMTFAEIICVMPVLEDAYDVGEIALEDDQGFQPRMYKTHFHYESCPKGAGKYIVIARELKDSVVSLYHFFKDWIFDGNALSLDEFVERVILCRGRPELLLPEGLHQFKHQASWYPHRKDANVLWLHYEDLKQDLNKCIKIISDFLDIGVGNQELLDLVERQASLEFMKAHATQFDAHPLKLKRNEAVGLDKYAGVVSKRPNASAKVREGQMNSGKKYLSPEHVDALDAKWQAIMKPITGYSTYEEMRASINKELGRFDS